MRRERDWTKVMEAPRFSAEKLILVISSPRPYSKFGCVVGFSSGLEIVRGEPRAESAAELIRSVWLKTERRRRERSSGETAAHPAWGKLLEGVGVKPAPVVAGRRYGQQISVDSPRAPVLKTHGNGRPKILARVGT